jgi:hypothetical protein
MRARMSEPAGEACARAERPARPLTTARAWGIICAVFGGRSALFERADLRRVGTPYRGWVGWGRITVSSENLAYSVLSPSRAQRTYNWLLKTATFDSARRDLMRELRLLDATNVVLSTNIPLRRDGEHHATMRPADGETGIAVYFTLRGKQMAMARDSFDNVAQNLRSLGLAIEALRQLARHGGGTMLDRAFAGFAALPDRSDWRNVLDVDPTASLAEAEATFRTLARHRHPDAPGGDHGQFQEINAAIQAARQHLGLMRKLPPPPMDTGYGYRKVSLDRVRESMTKMLKAARREMRKGRRIQPHS